MNSLFLKIVQFFQQLKPLKKKNFNYSKMAETSSDENFKTSLTDLDGNLSSNIIRLRIEIKPLQKDVSPSPEIDESSSSKSDHFEEKEKFLKRAVNLIPKSKKNLRLRIRNANNYHELEMDEKGRKTLSQALAFYFKLSKNGTIPSLKLRLRSLVNMIKINKDARKNFQRQHRSRKNFQAKDIWKFKLAFYAYFKRSNPRTKRHSSDTSACPSLPAKMEMEKKWVLQSRVRRCSHDCSGKMRPKNNFKLRYPNCDDDNNNDADNECSSDEEFFNKFSKNHKYW